MTLSLQLVRKEILVISNSSHSFFLTNHPYHHYSSSGYGLLLVSEGIDGTTHAAEKICNSPETLPEDLGKNTAETLLKDIIMVNILLGHASALLFFCFSTHDIEQSYHNNKGFHKL